MPPVECALQVRASTGEGPVWNGDEGALYWVDIPARLLNRFDPASGTNRSWLMPSAIGCFAFRQAGGVIAALQSGFHAVDLSSGSVTPLAEPLKDKPDCRFNDGRCDRAGRHFWAGTMAEPPDPRRPRGAFYRFGADGSCTKMIDGLIVSNGLAFSPDGRTMYISDSNAAVQTIWAFDYDAEEGALRNRRVFATTHDIAGRPDGAAVDADGCYWTAANSGAQLVRYTPAGKIDRTIALPVHRPTMPCFGGGDLGTLYVTSMQPLPGEPRHELDGSILAVRAGATGLPEPRFAG